MPPREIVHHRNPVSLIPVGKMDRGNLLQVNQLLVSRAGISAYVGLTLESMIFCTWSGIHLGLLFEVLNLLCSVDWPWAHHPLASIPWMLRLQVWVTTPGFIRSFFGGGNGNGVWIQALSLQRRHSTAWATSLVCFSLVILGWRLMNYLPKLPLSCDPPNLSLPSS
jgi:hypothetical protein